MQEGRYIYLIILAIVAGVAATLVARNRAPDTEVAAAAALMPGLAERVNDVTAISATGAGDAALLTLRKGEQAWTVAEKGDYPADPSKVRKFLLDLADAKLVEKKTGRPENFPRLGVEAVSAPEAAGVRVELAGLDDGRAVILGNSTRGGNARYVRVADEEQAWLADKNLVFAKDSGDWLNKDVMDVDAARVTAVTIRHPDGTTLAARRGAVNFEIADLPEGKVLNSPAAANSLANVLDGLRFEDVEPQATFEAGEAEPVAVTYETSDGLVIDARAYARDDTFYATFESRFDESVTEALPLPDSGEGGEEAAEPATDPETAAATREESERIDARVSGWVYKIPRYKHEQMSRKVDFFVKDAEGEDE